MARAQVSAKLPQIADVCRRYGVRELMLFGSAVGAGFGAESDLDFLVEFETSARVGLIHLGNLQEELQELLGRKVDLVPKQGLKPLVRDRVLQQAERVYARVTL